MATEEKTTRPAAVLHTAPSPHLGHTGRTTRWMMYDVVLALLPAVGLSLYVFGPRAAMVMAVSIITCLATEAIFQSVRGKKFSLGDGSAMVTGLILALSLPWTSPWWIPAVGGVVAIALGKMVFGGLGNNLFNPAMVGRAFLMICFTSQMAAFDIDGKAPDRATQEVSFPQKADTEGEPNVTVNATTSATPMAAGKFVTEVLIPDAKRPVPTKAKTRFALKHLLIGNVNGCLGETSAIALLLGGIYLCIRRTVAWQIPAAVIVGALIVADAQYLISPGVLSPFHHLLGGAMLFGAVFIATDPVSSPLSVRGRWVFGIGVGALTMIIRLFASYPEGMMFAVLLMNAITPMINRWTIPTPVGGKTPAPKPAAA